MPKTAAALAAEILRAPEAVMIDAGAIVIDLDDVALRRERLAPYVEATQAVIAYRFVFPSGAMVAAIGGGEPRDARAQLELIVGLTGGGVSKSQGGLVARIPKTLAAKFERLAGAMIEAYLVSLDLGQVG
jgi:hypothetical protein